MFVLELQQSIVNELTLTFVRRSIVREQTFGESFELWRLINYNIYVKVYCSRKKVIFKQQVYKQTFRSLAFKFDHRLIWVRDLTFFHSIQSINHICLWFV